MLADANREIRLAYRSTALARLQRQRVTGPMNYLDELIVGLEELHLKGITVLPDHFLSRLNRLNIVLPSSVVPPKTWPRRIARAIDLCFELQERVLIAQRRVAA